MKKLLIVLLFVVAGVSLCGNVFALSTYIPHITGGEAYWTDYLQVNNNAPSAANFTLTLYNNGDQIYSQVLSVGGFSRSQIELKALNPNAETGIVTYTEPGLVFRVSYNSWAGGIAEFKTIETLGSNVGFYFSDFTNFVQWKGSAIANMGTTPAEVTLYALGGSSWGSGGSILGTYTATINPRDKIVGVHSAWFSNINLSQIESIVAVTNSASLCGIAIGGDLTSSRLLFVPAISVFNFTPTTDANVTGTWKGAVTFTWADHTTTSDTVTLVLTQNSKTVSGTITFQIDAKTGNITGSVDGNNFTFFMAAGGTGAAITLVSQVNGYTMAATSASGSGSPNGTQVQISSWSGTLTKQ